MAEKRMVSKIISISEKVNSLPDVFDMLLFTWLIPHADDFGRLTGSPAKIKVLVVPLINKSASDVGNSIKRLSQHGLIKWYEIDSEKCIQIVDFEKHQTGLHKRTKSKFPEFPGSSEKFTDFPSELNRTEQNRTELKGTEQNDKSLRIVAKLFESEGFGTISMTIKDKLCELLDGYGEQWVSDAMRLSVVKGKRKLSFTEGILKNWKVDGRDDSKKLTIVPDSTLPTVAEVKADEERRKKERQDKLRQEMFGGLVDGAS